MISEKKVSIGDTLIVSVVKENREWGYNPAPDGTRLKVTGFHTQYRGRCGEFGRKPGAYIFNDLPRVVREDDGCPVDVGRWHLAYEDGSKVPMDLDGVWSGELPELPFWEGDTVNAPKTRFPVAMIVRIAYDDISTMCSDGVTPYPIYTVSPDMSAGITTSARESDLKLVKRGDIWKYYHGEPLEFESVAAEAQFYDGQLGRTKDVRNEICGLFSWTIEEAVNAIRDGEGDALSVTPALFGSKSRPYVKKFMDAEVGQRVREETLRGWADFDPKKFAVEIQEELDHRKEMWEEFLAMRVKA